MTEPLVTASIDDDGVALVTLADPANRNALRLELVRDLAAAVNRVASQDIGALIVTADPPVFCAGGSLDDLLTPRAPLAEMYAGFEALDAVTVPTIAAVNGAAIGAGANVALACDVILIADSATIDPRFLDIGIHPGGGHLRRLSDRVGRQGAAALSLCGDALTGSEAAAAGLAWRSLPDDELLPFAYKLARRAAGRPRELMRRAKATLDASIAAGTIAEAAAIELEVQQWSTEQPEFAERVKAMQERIARKA